MQRCKLSEDSGSDNVDFSGASCNPFYSAGWMGIPRHLYCCNSLDLSLDGEIWRSSDDRSRLPARETIGDPGRDLVACSGPSRICPGADLAKHDFSVTVSDA